MQTKLGSIYTSMQFYRVSAAMVWQWIWRCWQIEVLDFFLVLAQILEELLILASNGHFGGRRLEKGLDPRHIKHDQFGGFIGAPHFEQYPFRSVCFKRYRLILDQKVLWLDQTQVHVQGLQMLDSFQVPLSLDWKVFQLRRFLVLFPLSSSIFCLRVESFPSGIQEWILVSFELWGRALLECCKLIPEKPFAVHCSVLWHGHKSNIPTIFELYPQGLSLHSLLFQYYIWACLRTRTLAA